MKLEFSWVRNLFSSKSKVVQKSLCPFFETPFDPEWLDESFERRMLELSKRVNQIFQSMGGEGEVPVHFHRGLDGASASKEGIHLSGLYLNSPEEYPPHLRIKDPNDPKLDDPVFLKQLADLFWGPGVSFTKRGVENFRWYLRFMQDPEMAKRGFNFILHHEIAHIFHHHVEESRPPENFYYRFMIAVLVWLHEPIGKWLDQWIDNPTKRREREADRTALMLTKDVEGAIYPNQVYQAHYQQVRRCKPNWRNKLSLTPSGESVASIFSHYLDSNRNAFFKSALAQ